MPSSNEVIINKQEILNLAGDKTTVSLRSVIVRGLEKAYNDLNPGKKIKRELSLENGWITWEGKGIVHNVENVYIIAIGTLAEEMMLGALEALRGTHSFVKGLVTIPFASQPRLKTPNVEIIRANPQFFDGNAVRVAKTASSIIKEASGNDVIIYLLSPGARTMIAYPKEPLTPSHLEEVRFKLSRAGATPLEISKVLSHLDQVKGGQLASINPLAFQLSLVVAHVSNFEYEVIGDGITYPDESTYKEVEFILQKYNVWEKIDAKIKTVINKGIKGEISETKKANSKAFKRSGWFLLANTRVFVKELSEYFQKIGRLSSITLTDNFVADPQTLGRMAASFTTATGISRPYSLILAGKISSKRIANDSPVTDAAIAAMPLLKNRSNDVLLFLDTSGKDGHMTYAGVILTPQKAKEILGDTKNVIQLKGGFIEKIIRDHHIAVEIKQGIGAFGQLVLIISGK